MGFEAAEPVFDVFGFIEFWYGGRGHAASHVLPLRQDGLVFAIGEAVIDMGDIGGADLLCSVRRLCIP